MHTDDEHIPMVKVRDDVDNNDKQWHDDVIVLRFVQTKDA